MGPVDSKPAHRLNLDSILRTYCPQALRYAASTLYAASGRLIPFNSNSPTVSTFTAFSTFINTRGLMRI